MLLLFLLGTFNADKCFLDGNGQYNCDMQISLGLQIPEVTKNAAFKGICAAYKHRVGIIRYSYVRNLKYINFDGIAVDSIAGVNKFEMIMDLIIRLSLTELAEKEDISDM